MRRRVTLGIVASALLLVAVAGFIKFRDINRFSNGRELLRFLPNEPTAVLSVDFATLRRGGLLTDRTAPLEPEYRSFLEGTGFDYRRDLDLVIASFSQSGNYFVARGRFDWPKLRAYAVKQGGSCYDRLCRAPGSTAERRISFLPLRDNVIALAVSNDDFGATRLTRRGDPITAAVPIEPVWMSVSGNVLSRPGALPEGLRVSLSGLLDAERVLLTAGPGAHGIEARLDATCRTVDAARMLESQLRSASAVLKEALRQNKVAKDDSLAGLLSEGSFGRRETKVTGTWRIDPALIQGLTAGI